MSVRYKRVKQADGTFRHRIIRDKPRNVEAKGDAGQEEFEEAPADATTPEENTANSEEENAETPKEKPKQAKSKGKGKGDAGAKK